MKTFNGNLWHEPQRYDPYAPGNDSRIFRMTHAKGGGGTTTVQGEVDYEYNRRMAAIAERQQAMAEETYDWMWNNGYMDLETAKIAANLDLLPIQTGLQKEQLAAAQELLPGQTALAQKQIATGMAGQDLVQEKIAGQRALMPTYMEQINRGLDVRGAMNRASADVAQSFGNVNEQTRRDAARMGLSPSSNIILGRLADTNLQRAKATAAARTGARTTAEQTNLENLRQFMNTT